MNRYDTLRRWLSLAAKGGLSAALLAYVLLSVDLGGLWARLVSVRPAYLAAGCLLIAAQLLLNGHRWQLTLKALGTPMRLLPVLRIHYASMFVTSALAGVVGGDLVRAWGVRRSGFGLGTAVVSVLLDRMITVLGLLLVVTASLIPLHARTGTDEFFLVLAGICAAGASAILLVPMLERMPQRLRSLRGLSGIAGLGQASRRVLAGGRRAFALLLSAMASHACTVLAFHALALGLDLPVGLGDSFAVVPAVLLAVMLPISIGGWGVREAALVKGLGLVGIAPVDALSVSLLVGAVSLLLCLPGALAWAPDARSPAPQPSRPGQPASP